MSANTSIFPLTERIGLVRKDIGGEIKEKITKNGKVKILGSEECEEVILSDCEEISFGQSRSCRDIHNMWAEKNKERRTFSI